MPEDDRETRVGRLHARRRRPTEAPTTRRRRLEAEAPSWEGDGSTEVVPDDGEWGGDAPPRKNNLGGDDEVDATDLARGQ